MPRFYFDLVENGALALYGEFSQYAVLKDDGWCVHGMDFSHFGSDAHPTFAKRAIVDTAEHEFFHKWLRVSVSQVKVPGLFVIPFRRSYPRFILSGLMFLPDGTPFRSPHFVGSSKASATLLFRAASTTGRPLTKSTHPIIVSIMQSYNEKLSYRASHGSTVPYFKDPIHHW